MPLLTTQKQYKKLFTQKQEELLRISLPFGVSHLKHFEHFTNNCLSPVECREMCAHICRARCIRSSDKVMNIPFEWHFYAFIRYAATSLNRALQSGQRLICEEMLASVRSS